MELRQALTALLLLLPAAASAEVERFALVVGNDLGQGPDLPLRYAETDAARVVSVLQEVGGVRPENTVLLQGKDADTVRRCAAGSPGRSSPVSGWRWPHRCS